MTELWSDDQLDAALDGLHSDVPIDERVLSEARARMLAAATAPGEGNEMESIKRAPAEHPPSRRGGAGRWFAAAAAVIALSAGVVVVTDVLDGEGDRRPTAAEKPQQQVQLRTAAQVLQRAAGNLDARGSEVGDGEYLYVKQRARWGTSTVLSNTPHGQLYYVGDDTYETWIPADRSKLWQRNTTPSNEREWVVGTEQEAIDAGLTFEVSKPSTNRAKCGRFGADADGCDEANGSWYRPTPRWVAGLPDNARAMLQRLRSDTNVDKAEEVSPAFANAAILSTAGEGLRSGLLPDDVRALVYEAVALIPGIKITERVANVDGIEGTALGIESGRDRADIIVDADTGEFIGERTVVLRAHEGFKRGDVISSTSLTTAVVDELGERPEG